MDALRTRFIIIRNSPLYNHFNFMSYLQRQQWNAVHPLLHFIFLDLDRRIVLHKLSIYRYS